MYAGTDKYGGAVVAPADDAGAGSATGAGAGDGQTLAEAAATSSVEETLVAQAEDGAEVLLQAALNVAGGGGVTWAPVDAAAHEASYRSVVASSQMVSMLHDEDRNAAYASAITRAVTAWREAHGGARPVVLDIGTGTGLLAMLAARAGAKAVYACELFPRMASVAARVTADNGYGDVITVIPKKSTDVRVAAATEATAGSPSLAPRSSASDVAPPPPPPPPPMASPTATASADMPCRADILVTEIFDSALLGEGVLPTLRHAHAHLLVPGAVVVPRAATVYAHLVDSPDVAAMHDVSGAGVWAGGSAAADEPAVRFVGDKWAAKCRGGRVSLPMHTACLSPPPTPLCDPVEVLSFDFTVPLPAAAPYAMRQSRAVATASGTATAAHVWWTLDLADGVSYSTRPGDVNWQDHWVQMMCPIAAQPSVCAGDDIDIVACHTDVNLWFNAASAAASASTGSQRKLSGDPEVCMCGLHKLYNAQRISTLNDAARTSLYRDAIAAAVNQLRRAPAAASAGSGSDASTSGAGRPLLCMDVSDGSLCGLAAASLRDPTLTIVTLEEKPVAQVVVDDVCRGQGLSGAVAVVPCGPGALSGADALGGRKIDLLVSECCYLQMQTRPLWQAANFWLQASWLRAVGLLAKDVVVLPCAAVVRAALVEFEDLWRGHGSAGRPQDFDHAALDTACAEWHRHVFTYHCGSTRTGD